MGRPAIGPHPMRIPIIIAIFVALPAVAQAQEETRATKGFYPLIYHQQVGEKSEFGILGPLIQFQSEPGKSYSAFLPFFSIERDEPLGLVDIYVLWPLIRWQRRGDEIGFRIPPLIWHSSDPVSGSTVVLPLYWNFWDIQQTEGRSERHWFETLLPFYWNLGREPGNRYFHIWPLYGHHQRRDYFDSYFFLAPLFRYFQDRQKGEVGLDFPIGLGTYRRSADSYLFRFIPLIHLARGPKKSEAVLTPLFGHLANGDRTTTWLFPLYGSHTTPKYRLRAFILNLLVVQTSRKSREISLLWPLTSFRIDGDEKSLRVAPLLWASANPEGHSLLLLPLVYSRSSPQRSDFFAFPLFYNQRRSSGANERGMTLFLPLYYDFRQPKDRLTMLLPFFGFHSSEEDHTRYIFPTVFDIKRGDRHTFHAWPFYGHKEVGEHYDEYSFLWPFFSYSTDRQKDEWRLDLFRPFFSYQRGPDRESLRIVPFVWYDRSLKGRSTVIFPFYWSATDDDSSSFFIPPFYGEQRRGETFRRRIFLGGAYVHTEDKEKDLDRHDALFYLFTRKKEAGETMTAVRPLFWHTESPEESETILVPLFYRHRQKERSLFLSLLYSSGSVEGKSRWVNILGPIYHRSQNEERTSQEILFPLIHTSKGKDSSSLQVRPFFWHSREKDEGYTVAAPFYFHTWGPGRDAFNILPFYTRIEHPDGSRFTSILGPLYISKEEGTTTSQHFLWPFIHHYRGPGVEKWQVRPFFWHENLAGREKRTILFPFLWWYQSPRSSYLHLWPLFSTMNWETGGRKYRQVSTIYPFFNYSWDRDGEFRRLDLFFPLFRTQVDRGDATTWLFPFLFYDRERIGSETDTDLWILPPLFHSWSRGESSSWNILWKLITYNRDGDETDFRVLFELIRARNRDDSTLMRIWPLFSWERRGLGKAAPFEFSLLGSLFKYSSEGESSEFSVLGDYLFSYKKDPSGVRMNILHYFIRYEDSDDRFLFELNPLFSWESSKTSSYSYFSFLGGFFSLANRPSRTEVGLLYFIKL